MPEQLSLLNPPPAEPGDAITLAHYAERAYLEYALSVVKGRALPDVCDGAKPVQRRILYAMQRMGLGFGAGAAAMRYTAARLSPIARLLLDEIDEGTVDFVPNYDGSTEEPALLPARLPFVLLNGASGIAVGLATEVPSHNLREVAAAAVALIRDPRLGDDAFAALVPGPDFPGGAQIISAADEIGVIYAAGRGSLKVRARWKIEDLARGAWQLVVTELAPGTSAQRVLEEVEELTNPKVKTGKKALTAEQTQLKASVLAVLDAVRDESGKEAAVRLVFEPRTRTVEPSELIAALLAHTSLETSVPVNLTMIGRDGRPTQKSLRRILEEWIDFRRATVLRRTEHRLARVRDRIHVLEGRQLVLLHIDEVIRIIRASDEPKPALIARFRLSERQADDILEIRLRQLARLEAIRIEQELASLRDEQGRLDEVLRSPKALERTLVREIEADAKAHGDERRTLIQPERRAVAEIRDVDEPVTVIVSARGWVRTMKGHEVDAQALAFKPGDALYGTYACRSVDALLVFGSAAGGSVRVYTVAVASLPGGRGDGVPVTSLIDLESGTQQVQYWAGAAETTLLLANSGGFGLLAKAGDLHGRNRAGRAFLTVADGDAVLAPAVVAPAHRLAACLARDGRLLVFALDELKLQPNGGKGLTLIDVEVESPLVSVLALADALRVIGTGRGAKPRDELLRGERLAAYAGRRARKGRRVEGVLKPERLALPIPAGEMPLGVG